MLTRHCTDAQGHRPGVRVRGFSLVELMVTIAIMVLMMAAVLPSMSDWIANMRLRGAAEAVLTGLQKTRAEAVKTNQLVSFWLVSPSNAVSLDNTCALLSTSASWVISVDDPTGACGSVPSATASPRLVEAHGAGPVAAAMNVAALNQASEAATRVRFTGFGQRPVMTPDTDIRTIDFTSTTAGTQRLRIEITSGGSARMCDRDALVTVPPDPKACLL